MPVPHKRLLNTEPHSFPFVFSAPLFVEEGHKVATTKTWSTKSTTYRVLFTILFQWVQKSTQWKKSLIRTRFRLGLFRWTEKFPHGGKKRFVLTTFRLNLCRWSENFHTVEKLSWGGGKLGREDKRRWRGRVGEVVVSPLAPISR